MLSVSNITVKIKNNMILNNITCSLLPKTITCFIGESGAGKTTLLKSLVQLLDIENGQINIKEKNIKSLSVQERAKNIGFVFQNFNLFANLTVLNNCLDPLLIQKIDKIKAQKIAIENLANLGLIEYINRYPCELSGGQQQRAAIARSLCLSPKILLLDEPTASLDPVNTLILIDILKSLAKNGLTIGVSSQDMNFVKNIFDRAYFLRSGLLIEECEKKDDLAKRPIIRDFIYS